MAFHQSSVRKANDPGPNPGGRTSHLASMEFLLQRWEMDLRGLGEDEPLKRPVLVCVWASDADPG